MILFLSNTQKLDTLFLLSEIEKKALLSIEKPILKVVIKEETLKQLTQKKFIRVKLFDDAPSAILAKMLQEESIDYLFVKIKEDLELSINKEKVFIIKANSIALKPEKLVTDEIINRFLNMTKEFDCFDTSSIGAYYNSQNLMDIIFRSVNVNKKLVSLEPFKSHDFLKRIKEEQISRGILLNNFKEKFPSIYKSLEKLQEDNESTLFDVLSVILELDKTGFEALSDASLEFLGNGGLKIDTKFKNKKFDYNQMIAAVMSFKLADVHAGLLSYSIFESLGDLAADVLTQVKESTKTKCVILFGNMLVNAPFYSRLQRNISHLKPKISSWYPIP